MAEKEAVFDAVAEYDSERVTVRECVGRSDTEDDLVEVRLVVELTLPV